MRTEAGSRRRPTLKGRDRGTKALVVGPSIRRRKAHEFLEDVGQIGRRPIRFGRDVDRLDFVIQVRTAIVRRTVTVPMNAGGREGTTPDIPEA